MTDTAKLREALDEYTPNPGIIPSDPAKRVELDRYWERRSLIFNAAQEHLALLESPDIILIRRDAEGNWPRKARQKVSFALSEAAGLERRNALTASAFLTIQYELLNVLAGAGIDD